MERPVDRPLSSPRDIVHVPQDVSFDRSRNWLPKPASALVPSVRASPAPESSARDLLDRNSGRYNDRYDRSTTVGFTSRNSVRLASSSTTSRKSGLFANMPQLNMY